MSNGIAPADYTTDVGLVRLLIPDTAVDEVDEEYIFGDDQIEALLTLFPNIKRAAAQAKDIIATDTVLLIKYVRTDDLTVDGPKVAAELRLQAKQLRDQADADDQAEVFDYFKIVYQDKILYPEGVPAWGRSRVEITEVEDPTPWA